MKILQVLIFSLSFFVNAQAKEKLFVLSGTVYGVENAVISATHVTAENKDGRKFQTTSNESGVYKLSIPFGEYTLVFHKEGFKITKYTNFENSTLLEKTFDANLEVRTCYDCNGDIYGENNSDKRNPQEIKLSNTAILSGTLYDASGAVVPKAKVTAVNEKGEVFAAETNNEGIYLLNLPYKNFDAKTSSANFRISKYKITVDLTDRGFEKFAIKEFKFVPTLSGKMYFDIALDSSNPESCGYGGYCPPEPQIIEEPQIEVLDKILKRPLEKFPKAKNKNKRKNN